MTGLVWYAAYGSNLSRPRFDFYLRGGTPQGASHAYPGARDPTEPIDDRPWEIGRELVFGGNSRTWGGGVAFVDPDAEVKTKARLYLITAEQFADVVAQENWLPPGEVAVPGFDDGLELIVGADHTYGLVLSLGALDGHPILTFTQHRGTRSAAPSTAYLRHIGAGLREAHAMSVDEIVDYLSDRRGIRDVLPKDAVLGALTG
ncbi:MAG: histone deacetylase [Actinomycetota bacterium]